MIRAFEINHQIPNLNNMTPIHDNNPVRSLYGREPVKQIIHFKTNAKILVPYLTLNKSITCVQ
jgi:hypothetical protein